MVAYGQPAARAVAMPVGRARQTELFPRCLGDIDNRFAPIPVVLSLIVAHPRSRLFARCAMMFHTDLYSPHGFMPGGIKGLLLNRNSLLYAKSVLRRLHPSARDQQL